LLANTECLYSWRANSKKNLEPEAGKMHALPRQLTSLAGAFAVGLTLFSIQTPTAFPQEKKAPQVAGVDNTKMGAYRALAQVAFAAFQKGDTATAGQLARVLERLWDKAEDYGGDTALKKTNADLFEEIDKAMDQFVTPLMNAAKTPPEAAKVKAAYNAYLEALKLAD
jgi:hypothetical protein